jgi:hypothetical protein
VTSLGLLSLKNVVNVPSKSNQQKNFIKKLVFVGLLKFDDENSRIRPDPHPDPLVRARVSDPH